LGFFISIFVANKALMPFSCLYNFIIEYSEIIKHLKKKSREKAAVEAGFRFHPALPSQPPHGC
jgi:hypothetical protein